MPTNYFGGGINHANRGLPIIAYGEGISYRFSPPGETKQRVVLVRRLTTELLKIVQQDPRQLFQLSPGAFQDLLAELLKRMGCTVEQTGHVNAPDGGNDLVARYGPYCLLGVQAKHHRTKRDKVGGPQVQQLLAWRGTAFSHGLLVTNTGFTTDAISYAKDPIYQSWLRLRGEADIQRWLDGDFSQEGREVPTELKLAKNRTIRIPDGILLQIRSIKDPNCPEGESQ
jgi:hypothetical protein